MEHSVVAYPFAPTGAITNEHKKLIHGMSSPVSHAVHRTTGTIAKHHQEGEKQCGLIGLGMGQCALNDGSSQSVKRIAS